VVYLIISDFRDFEQNFSTAWSQKAASLSVDTLLFVKDMSISAPMRFAEANVTTEETIQQIKLFYRLLKTKRGLPEVIIPRRLRRIDAVDVSTMCV
jgi:hypothetical protein